MISFKLLFYSSPWFQAGTVMTVSTVILLTQSVDQIITFTLFSYVFKSQIANRASSFFFQIVTLHLLWNCNSAKPIEQDESEPEEEFVSSLPIYDLPIKREKTDLEQYDTPEKEQQQRIKPVVDEPSPDWDRLKKKPESEEDPKKIVLGKGDMPGTLKHFIRLPQ